VVAYQNACLNASHELDDEHEAFYMSPGLLSNALFRRDFPLGVDKRIAQYRWRFAVENSGGITLVLGTPVDCPNLDPSLEPRPNPTVLPRPLPPTRSR
jgi:hypothetical protein